jgi:hypothetical protein
MPRNEERREVGEVSEESISEQVTIKKQLERGRSEGIFPQWGWGRHWASVNYSHSC